MKPLIWTASVFLLLAVAGAQADDPTRRVQEELRKRNLYFGDVNGEATPELAAALRRYQERKGFAPTGRADADTLASLKLATPAETTPSELPAEPVFRSDQAREVSAKDRAALEAAFHEPEPEETPLPVGEAPEEDQAAKARAFIADYLAQGERNDLAGEMAHYADPIDYFDHGVVDLGYVRKDVGRYYHRWPERSYKLVGPPFVGTIRQDDRLVVNFGINFTVKSPGRSASGRTEYLLTIDTSEPAWKILSIKERRAARPAAGARTP